MSKLVYAINITADGCCDHTSFNPDDEVLDYFTALNRNVGVLLYGRKTYELMIPYWPESLNDPTGQSKGEVDFARSFVAVPKTVVFSRTLKEPQEGNTTVVRGNLQAEIEKLKAKEGKDILVGGVDLPSQLLALGLVDEMHFLMHPVIAGNGRRLIETVNLSDKLPLELVRSHAFKSGSVALHYRVLRQ